MARIRPSVLSVIALVLVAPLLSAPPAQAAGTTYISFEDRPLRCSFDDTQPLRGHYAAAKFRGPTATGGGAVLDTCGGFGVAPRTGSRFLAFNTGGQLANGGVPRGPERISLTTRQKRVTIWVSQTGTSVGDATFRLVARRRGTVVARATRTTDTAAWVRLTVRVRRGIDAVTLSAPGEPDGCGSRTT
ncbi:hypothetical protein [Nocardioides euryhalodurans]|uniref:Uncharacterized protein n=1 Tax=Nocardioides euryhalodurans TaxID=2518370 RepID=A0A4P7GL38_9ACTN|nr:hypothetical protein [Nocardioides euryhalodurans]QBR92401.1 hypothetical protein EXE57_08955 [Nocardioides euryhalodurans]